MVRTADPEPPFLVPGWAIAAFFFVCLASLKPGDPLIFLVLTIALFSALIVIDAR